VLVEFVAVMSNIKRLFIPNSIFLYVQQMKVCS